jgi:hypothetical protein
MQIILSLFFSLIFGILAAYVATKKERRATLWFFFGVLGGIFGLLIILFMPKLETPVEGDYLNDWINKKRTKKLPLQNLPASKMWYYVTLDRTSLGPVSLLELQNLYAAGTINSHTLVWYDGLAGWQKIRDFP